MGNSGMPDYESEANEWESNKTVKFARFIEVQIKAYTQRIQMAHTVQALAAIKNDVERGTLANNQEAKNQLRRTANLRARELGFKEGQWW